MFTYFAQPIFSTFEETREREKASPRHVKVGCVRPQTDN